MLIPGVGWKWSLDDAESGLIAHLDAGLSFVSAYQSEQLLNIVFPVDFSVEQSQIFADCMDALVEQGVPFTESQLTQICLNTTAALSFHVQIKSKSWLYEIQSDICQWQPYQLAWINNQGTEYLVITLEQDGNTVLCMNLSDLFISQDGQKHEQFSLLKVLSNRQFSLLKVLSNRLCGLENAENDDEQPRDFA